MSRAFSSGSKDLSSLIDVDEHAGQPHARSRRSSTNLVPAGNIMREGVANPGRDQAWEIGRHRDEYRPVAVSGSGFWSAIQAAYLGTLVLVGVVLLGRPIIKGLQSRRVAP